MDFKDEFGLIIPSNPMLTILNRLSKHKYVVREHGKFVINFENIEKVDQLKHPIQNLLIFAHRTLGFGVFRQTAVMHHFKKKS